MMLYIKYKSSGPCCFRQDFLIAFWKHNFWPRNLLLQPISTIWIILVGDHPGIIAAEFGQIPISGSREEVVWSFPYTFQCTIVTPGQDQF